MFNRQAIRATRPARRQDAMFLVNPCVTGDTWVMTDQGARQVNDLVGVPHIALINGQRHETTPDGFWETGVRPVLLLQTREGYTLRLTANHPVMCVVSPIQKDEKTAWFAAGELKPGDRVKLHNHREAEWEGSGTVEQGWLLGYLVGNGTFTENAVLYFYGEHRAEMAEQAVAMLRQAVRTRSDLRGHSQDDQDRTVVQSAGLRELAADFGIYRGKKTITPEIEQGSSAFCRGFLRGQRR
jgi:intein/homing endonuclease